jgi:hypothetical protein
LVVHLVNGSGATPPRWSEPAAVHDVTIRFRWDGPTDAPAPQVRAARADAGLPARAVDGGYEVMLPRLDLFELLTVSADGAT